MRAPFSDEMGERIISRAKEQDDVFVLCRILQSKTRHLPLPRRATVERLLELVQAASAPFDPKIQDVILIHNYGRLLPRAEVTLEQNDALDLVRLGLLLGGAKLLVFGSTSGLRQVRLLWPSTATTPPAIRQDAAVMPS